MRKFKILPLFVFAFLITFRIISAVAGAANPEWQELKGEHFIINFLQDKKFATEVLDKAERYYRNIAFALGYPRYEEFWLWEKRVKIYIYSDKKSYLSASGQPEWSEGMADYTNKSISTIAGSGMFLDSVLPHEIAHLIFRDFVGFKGEVPLWLDEGVAQWAENRDERRMAELIKEFYREDKFLSMNDMMKLNMRILKEKDGVVIRPARARAGGMTTLILSTENLVNTYYIEAVSIITFLVEKYGSDKFASFCRELRDGKTTENALKSAYPDYIRSISELEDRWRRYLEEQM
jgi:hypothetical protein